MPDFASQTYWDLRFAKDKTPFDWLVPARALREITFDIVEPDVVKKCQILHIGCGTSDSSVLRDAVEQPEQVHNVDYSETAVSAARERETFLLQPNAGAEDLLEMGEKKHDSVQPPSSSSRLPQSMRWSCMDLLSLQSTLALLHHQVETGKLYDLVLDKSTSDSISCGSDLTVNLPYTLSINGWTRRIISTGTQHVGSVHPLHILAIHLAALTTPGRGRWICVSYSEERFPFLPPFPTSDNNGLLSDEVIKAGFTHPYQLWKLERKEKILPDDDRTETLTERKKRLASGMVHRPQINHWLYVLRRTDAVVRD